MVVFWVTVWTGRVSVTLSVLLTVSVRGSSVLVCVTVSVLLNVRVVVMGSGVTSTIEPDKSVYNFQDSDKL